jgi:hypothetical protein
MRWSPLLPGIVVLSLLGACGVERTGPPPPTTEPTTEVETTAETTPATTSEAPLTATAPEVRQAYDAAAASYPNLDPEVCTLTTRLGDETCGQALSAMNEIAGVTAQSLGAQNNPVHQPVLSAATDVGRSYAALLDPVPCYGLSEAQAPPPPLEEEARGLCAEGADIMKLSWNIFLSEVSLLGDP